MGKLIEGEWIVTHYYIRRFSMIANKNFLDIIEKGHEKFQLELGRYHLYVSYACPWATRTLIYRQLKDLNDHISVSVVHPDMLEEVWIFDTSFPGATEDHLYGKKFLREIYQKADPTITTSVTVPILWDKKTETIVNNESSQIIRILNTAFNDLTGNHNDYYPEDKRELIDELNDIIYDSVNNGVYKSGFALSQEAYDNAVSKLFEILDFIDNKLSKTKFLIGDEVTEADLRLIPTLLRFDPVYVTHFKCNIRRIMDYKNLYRYMQDMLKIPAVKDTCYIDHIKRHYYYSHDQINPYRIIPHGPIEL